MQETSHKTRNDCTKLRQKLSIAESENQRMRAELDECQTELNLAKDERSKTEVEIINQIQSANNLITELQNDLHGERARRTDY